MRTDASRAARALGWLAALSMLVSAPAAVGFEHPLFGGRVARFRTSPPRSTASIQFSDAALAALGDPRCPASSRLRLVRAVDEVTEVDLPCAHWQAARHGYRYVDPLGASAGVRRIVARRNRLLIRFGGPHYSPVIGPLPFVEAALTIGADGVCGRFSRFGSNAAGEVEAVGPSEPCRLPRPNFLVVVLDDVRADGIDWMPVVQSEMAGKGATFPNAFVTDAVCCPSRASILTGLYALRHGTRQVGGPIGGAHVFRESGADRETLAVWLNDAGYATGLFGKYLNAYSQTEHDKGPNGTFYVPPGWDSWWAFVSPEHYGGVLGTSYEIVDESGAVTAYTDHSSDAEYSTDLSAARVREFIAGAVGAGRPFFAYWAPYAGHGETPAVLPAPALRHGGLFASLPLWRPPSWNESDVSDKPLWVRQVKANLAGDPGTLVAAITDLFRQEQYESLLAADEQLASMLGLLADLGADDDTVVLLVSDNGVGWGEHQSWSTKESPYEESIRVPLIVRYPRRIAPAPRSVAAAALNIDIAPTVADLAGADLPYEPDGRSLRAWLVGSPPPDWRSDFLLEYWRPGRDSRLNYFGQAADGDRLLLLTGDPRAEPRPSVSFEFDADGEVGPDRVAVAIGAIEDTTFANLVAAAVAAVPGAAGRLNAGSNTLTVSPADPLRETVQFRVERQQRGSFVAVQPIPDYLGVRDVVNGRTWVEHETGERELYDLGEDPDQLENRADDPAYALVRSELEARLEALVEEIEARRSADARLLGRQ